MNRTILAGLLVATLIPAAQAHDASSTEYLEWEQHLFDVNFGAGGSATLANTTFTIQRNDSRAVVSGNSLIRITGYVVAQGDVVQQTAYSPQAIFDGAASRWKAANFCIMSEMLIRAGTNVHVNVDMECRLVQHYTSGTHGLRVDDFSGCLGANCPDGTDLGLSFTLVNREWVTTLRPDPHTEIQTLQNTANRIEPNVQGDRATGNATSTTVNSISSRIGFNTDPATEAWLATGTVFSKLRGLSNQTGNATGGGNMDTLSVGTEVGTTSTFNILVILTVAILGVYLWRRPDRDGRPDLFMRVVGGVVCLVAFILAIEFRNSWVGGLGFALTLGILAGYLVIVGAMKEVEARKGRREEL